MEVMMISRGVEISFAGGVAETEDDHPLMLYVVKYRFRF